MIVVVPSKWKFLGKFEESRKNTSPEDLGELVYNWHFWEQLVHSRFVFGGEEPFASVTTKTFYPDIRGWRNMAEESLRLDASALERLTLNQQAHG